MRRLPRRCLVSVCVHREKTSLLGWMATESYEDDLCATDKLAREYPVFFGRKIVFSLPGRQRLH